MTRQAETQAPIPGRYRAILYGGMVAGALDLVYALVANAMRGVDPVRILQSISSGLLGSAAYERGAASAALGVLLHFMMMFAICGIYFAASRRLTVLTERPIAMGLVFGAAVYVVMSYVVLPLSAFPHQVSHAPASIAVASAAMLLCVGVPIALIVRRFG